MYRPHVIPIVWLLNIQTLGTSSHWPTHLPGPGQNKQDDSQFKSKVRCQSRMRGGWQVLLPRFTSLLQHSPSRQCRFAWRTSWVPMKAFFWAARSLAYRQRSTKTILLVLLALLSVFQFWYWPISSANVMSVALLLCYLDLIPSTCQLFSEIQHFQALNTISR